MDENKARALAALLGGEAWQSGGGIYVVLVTNRRGQIVGITDECVCLYPDSDAFDENRPAQTIDML